MFGGEYSQGGPNMPGQDFAAAPRLIMGKPKFKDPYGKNIEEYFPQNIMHDRRIMRGSTYAAMVIPAGTNPDAMVMEKNYPKKQTFRQPGGMTKRSRNIYPNRDIPTPEPVPGRSHMDIQTEPYKEILTDKPPEREQGIATEFYLDRPPVPLFQPRMPPKDCCKSTQIYEGDDELFDFNEEVEPMLNVLCQKTLEQARMEVLEETELEIMKRQQKEYEEIVNAEIIMAQRFEAAEQRCAEEVDRRQLQDKARKEDKRLAHQKINARTITKNYLSGLREQALGELSAMGVLQPPKYRAMEDTVVPWLMDKIQDFLKEDKATIIGSVQVVRDGIVLSSTAHKQTIRAKYDKIQQDKDDKIEAEKQNQIRKQNRRLAREKRAKDDLLEKYKDQIERNIIFKGEIREVIKENLHDVHGNYSRESYIGTFGGQLMQLFYVFEEITNRYPQGLKDYMQKKIQKESDEDYFTRPNNLRELCTVEHQVPFLMHYLKDMKNECIELLLHPLAVNFLSEINVDFEDLNKLDDDQLTVFKDLVSKNRSRHLRGLGKTMDTLFENLVDIAAKRVPVDGSNVKWDAIRDKIRFVASPNNPAGKPLINEDYDEIKQILTENGEAADVITSHKSNVSFESILHLKVQQREEEEEIPITPNAENAEDEEEKEPVETITKMIDEDQNGKTLAVVTREIINLPPDTIVFQINQYAGRCYRENFVEYIRSYYPEFFDDNEDQELIMQSINSSAENDINKYLTDMCGEYEKPCLEFEINAQEIL